MLPTIRQALAPEASQKHRNFMKIAPPKCDPKRVRGALVCMACNMMQADGRSREFDCRPSADFGAARALHGVHLPQAKRRGVPKSNSNRSKGFCKNRGRKCIDEDEQNCGVNEKSANHWSNVVNFGFGSHLGPREYSLKRWPIRKRATQLIKQLMMYDTMTIYMQIIAAGPRM